MSKFRNAFAALCCCFVACSGSADVYPFEDYASMRTRMGELFQQDSLQEAADLLEWALREFPDHIEPNAFNLALVYGRMGETSKGLDAMNFAFEQDVWFNVYGLQAPLFDPYRDLEGFQEVMEKNDSLRLVAQATAVPDLKVVLPDGYSADREYPLFIALHGGSSNMEEFSNVWQSELLSTEFIIAYVQSSLVVSMGGFSWTQDLEVSRREVTDAYLRMVREYSIDRSEVLVGGFSAGGITALELVLAGDFSMAGFVTLCPPLSENFDRERLGRARGRGVRGTILTTEMDPNIEAQREMAALLEETNFPHEFVVTPNVGHWFPDNLGELIDRAVEHIREAQ